MFIPSKVRCVIFVVVENIIAPSEKLFSAGISAAVTLPVSADKTLLREAVLFLEQISAVFAVLSLFTARMLAQLKAQNPVVQQNQMTVDCCAEAYRMED